MNTGLQKTSLINFPGRIAAAVFLPGCNLRCPYCYNAELACASCSTGPHNNGRNIYVPVKAVYELIQKRKNIISGFVISGGEALLSPSLPALIHHARHAGLAVKLDTNGLLPDALAALLHSRDLCPDMIAIDIKTDPARYNELHYRYVPSRLQEYSTNESAHELLLRTCTLLQNGNFSRTVTVEYRTVLVPPLVKKKDIRAMAALLPHTADWFFSPFLPEGCLNPSWDTIEPYSQPEMEQLLSYARTFIPKSNMR